jgi:hypothetical protein
VAPPKSNQERIAHLFLRALGAPDTPAMRRAVVAWLRAEGVSSIKRNNPWNLHGGAPCGTRAGQYCPGGVGLPGAVGRYNAGPGDKNVVVFESLEAGVAANANNLVRLRNSGYGYDRVIEAARAGKPVAFLDALARSSWSAGRYRIDPHKPPGGANNKLLRIFRGLGGDIGGLVFNDMAERGADADPKLSSTPAMLGAWGDAVSLPEGHVLTAEDVDRIVTTLRDRGFFQDDPLGVGEGLVRETLTRHVGERWDKGLQDKLQAEFNARAKEAGDLGGYRGVVEGAAGLLASLADPGHWALFLALLGGGALALVGGYMTLRAVSER